MGGSRSGRRAERAAEVLIALGGIVMVVPGLLDVPPARDDGWMALAILLLGAGTALLLRESVARRRGRRGTPGPAREDARAEAPHRKGETE